MNSLIRYLTVVVVLFTSSISFSAVLITDSDFPARLLGASDVDVNGVLYDITFQDGTCVGLFNGCNELSDFTFSNEIDATAAAQALLDQVLLDIVFPGTTFLNSYDSLPNFVAGCETAPQFIGCHIVTPYTFIAGLPFGKMVQNFYFSTEDDVFSEEIASYDTLGLSITYAIWSEVSEIPLPATAWLFLSTFGSLLGFKQIKCGTNDK